MPQIFNDYKVVPGAFPVVSYASVTATTIGSATTLGTLTRLCRQLALVSKLNADTWITMDGVNLIPLPALASVVLDAGADGSAYPLGTVFGVYCMSGTPTSGWVGVAPL